MTLYYTIIIDLNSAVTCPLFATHPLSHSLSKYSYCNDAVCTRRPERKRLIKKVPETNQYTNPLINCPKFHRFPICPNSLPPSLPSFPPFSHRQTGIPV